MRGAGDARIARNPKRDPHLPLGEEAQHDEGVVQRVGAIGVRPRLRPDPIDGLGVEPPEVGRARRVEPAPRRHGPGAALLERGVVEECVRLRVQDLVREGGGLREVAGVHRDLAPLDAREEGHEAVHVHRLVERIVDGLLHEGMLRDLPLPPSEVLSARDLVGEHHRNEVLGLHPLDRGRDLAPARTARDRERDVRVPAPAHVEQGRVEQGLDQHVPGARAREVPRHLVEREAVGLPERENDVVLGGRRLELEVEAPAEALAKGQPERPVDPPPDRGVDDELHPPRLVEEALDDEVGGRRHDPKRGLPGREVVHELTRRLLRKAGFSRRPAGGSLDPVRDPVPAPDEAPDGLPQPRHRLREGVGPGRRLADPERDGRGLAPRVLDPDPVRLDPEDAPGVKTELEDVPGQGLDREVLVEGADHGAGRLEDHRVVGVLRDRPRVREGGHPRPPPGPEPAVHPVPVDERPAAPPPRGEAGGEHVDHRLERLVIEGPVRPGAPDEGEQLTGLPFASRDLGHDLLREDVEGTLGQGEGVELSPAHGVEEGRALHEVVAAQGEEASLRGRLDPMPGAADPLQEGRDVAGRAELADEVDVADVDAELERRGGDEEGEGAALEALLGLEPPLAREAPVVGGDLLLAEALGEGAGGAFGEPARVREDEGRAVLAGEGSDAVVDLVPHLGRHHRLERRGRELDGEVAEAVEALVDDRAGGFVPVPDEEARDEVHRALGGGKADAPERSRPVLRRKAVRLAGRKAAGCGPAPLRRSEEVRLRIARAPAAVAGRGGVRVRAAVRRTRRGAERLQPLQGEGEVCPPFVARDGMDLVDDDRPRPRERVPPRLARQQDVERLGGGDEDVGRLPGHRLTGGGRGVARAHHRPNCDRRLAQALRPLRDPAKGRLEVALDVVGEGLEGRHVDDPDRVVEASAPRLLGKLVDDREERGEGLAGAGGGGDEGVSAGPHLGPRLRLAGGGGGELGLEPGADGGVAERTKRHRRTVHHGPLPVQSDVLGRRPMWENGSHAGGAGRSSRRTS